MLSTLQAWGAKALTLIAIVATGGLYLMKLRADRDRAEREADQQRHRADTAEARHAQVTRIDRAREKLAHQHQEEQRHAQEHLESGRRDGLDNDWG